MPTLRACSQPGCPSLVARGRCTAHRRDQERYRPNVDVRRLYRSVRWQRDYRDRKKNEAPFCVDCEAEGRLVVWDELDHIVPHRGDLTLFWDYSNVAGRCRMHHQQKTNRGL